MSLGSRETTRAMDDGSSSDSAIEVEQTICSLRQIVCDLLRRNQELRYALIAARLGPEPTLKNHNQG